MTGDREPEVAARWLVVATLPGGERYVVVPPDGQAVDHEKATDLASAVDWHSSVHAVSEVVRVWRAAGWDPEADGCERYDLGEPRQSPFLEHEPQAPQPGPGLSSSQVFYLVDGEPTAGTVEDYIVAHAQAQLDLIEVPEVVWTWHVVLTPDAPGGASWGWTVHTVESTSTDHDGLLLVELSVLDQDITYLLLAPG
jgi:hypothetical protein